MNINFTQLLGSFSLALDLGENKSLNHAKRAAFFKIAENSTQLTSYDKLMGVCDIYTAITEERPYRKGDDPEIALKKIKPQVDKGLLCPDSFKLLSDTML